ncbi:hypothetical protein [Actinokineospora sp. NBRC 105648]|uniref:hypothetical protein n=1 Tax=Actinokineospora sp. NBRC 105648 TaxID=3032206 RepID=UPI0024A26EB7|nr:hypothetical protein [Actinokineospora sp. NBRC 105648]GLZ43679.1 hypothetical protein Acsp05_73030 [Actinokineospora sp. NBRC 105648]
MTTDGGDPLAQITLAPRAFAAVLAVVALVTGLVLAIVPVGVAHPDPAHKASVTCGNTLGGVETDAVVADLGQPDRDETTRYLDMCERAISNRGDYAVILFFGGFVGGLALSVVRRKTQAQAQAET